VPFVYCTDLINLQYEVCVVYWPDQSRVCRLFTVPLRSVYSVPFVYCTGLIRLQCDLFVLYRSDKSSVCRLFTVLD